MCELIQDGLFTKMEDQIDPSPRLGGRMRDDPLHVTNYIKNINGDLIISLTDMYSELCLLYNIIFCHK